MDILKNSIYRLAIVHNVNTTMQFQQGQKLAKSTVAKQAGAGGRVPPDAFHREFFDDLPGKEREGKRGN